MLASRGRRRTISRTSKLFNMATGWHTAQRGKLDRHVKRANHGSLKHAGFRCVTNIADIENKLTRIYNNITNFIKHIAIKCGRKQQSSDNFLIAASKVGTFIKYCLHNRIKTRYGINESLHKNKNAVLTFSTWLSCDNVAMFVLALFSSLLLVPPSV